MKARALVEQPSQGGGELSPFLQARRDLERWATSHRRVENFVPLQEAVLQRRPGTRYLAAAYDAARPVQFIPFTFAGEDALMLVLNAGVIRFFAPDGTPVETAPGSPYQLAHPWSDIELDGLRWWQQGNLVFIASPTRRPQVLTRLSATSWSIAPYDTAGGPVDAMNAIAANKLTVSAATGSIVVTANFNAFTTDMVGGVWRMEEETFESIAVWSPQETVSTGVYRRWKGRIYSVTSAGSTSSGVNPPEHDFGAWSSGGGNAQWTFVSKAYGYFRIQSWISTSQVTATVLEQIPQSLVGGYTWRFSPSAWDDARTWPGDVHMHQNSLVWARGDVMWMTKPGDFYDFDIPPTASEDAGNAFRLTSPVGQLIQTRFLASSLVLIAGTSVGAFIVRGANAADRLTLANTRAWLDADDGAAAARPARTGGGALFIGVSRRTLHFMAYAPLSERVEVSDLTRYARTVLRKPIAEIAFQRHPHRVLWLRHDDGALSSVTFWPEEQMLAVARHPLGGGQCVRLAALVSPGQEETAIWMAVRRTVAGVLNVYYEKLAPYFLAADADAPTAVGAWHLDCALEYGGAPATVLSGLGHLEGESVLVNADGRQAGPFTVAAGAITLPFPTTQAIVGLAAPARLETLPREMQTRAGSSVGRAKRLPRAALELFETLDVSVATKTKEGELPADLALPQGGAVGPLQTPRLVSGVVPLDVETSSDLEQTLVIRAAGVFPCTVLAAHADLEAQV